MKKNTIIKAFATFVAGCLVMGTVGCTSGAQTKEPFVITNTVGTVMVSENGENSVSTKDDGSVDFDLDDTKKVGLDVNSSATVTADGNKKIVRLENGGLYFYTTEKVAEGEEFIIEMDSLKVRITGTSGYIIYNEKTGVAKITLSSGQVHLIGTNPVTGGTNEIDITAGDSAQVCLFDYMEGSDSVRFEMSKITPADLPPLLVQKIVAVPEVFDRVVEETGWDAGEMSGIAASASCVNAAVPGSDQYAAASAAAQAEAMTVLDTRFERAEEAEAAGVSLVGDNEVVVSGGDVPDEAAVNAMPEVAPVTDDSNASRGVLGARSSDDGDSSKKDANRKDDKNDKDRNDGQKYTNRKNDTRKDDSRKDNEVKKEPPADPAPKPSSGDATPDGGGSSSVGGGGSSSKDSSGGGGGSSSGGGGSSSSGGSSGSSSSAGSSGSGSSASGTESGSGTTAPAPTYTVTLQFDSNALQAWIIEEGNSSQTLTSKAFSEGAEVKIAANKRDHHEAPILSLPGDLTSTATDGDGFTVLYTFTMPASDVLAILTAEPEPMYNVSVQWADGCRFARDDADNPLMPSIKSGCETSYYNNDHVSILIENLPIGVTDNIDHVYLYRGTVSESNFIGNATYARDDSSGEDEISFQMTNSNVIIYFAPEPATP